MTFTAIDFETAKGNRNSACAVGIITVENGKTIEEYNVLIQPPENDYFWKNIEIHGISPEDTANAPNFKEIYPEIKKRLQGKTLVAHNEIFDRSVLQKTMAYYDLDYSELNLAEPWECTFSMYGRALDVCCEKHNIELNHHDALSDARACAELYLRK
ncbi:MAG: 3'-5' exonuclease [Bacteroidota bacterium]|nr:3'-5' exonuclease [Bacteroidota bacterium]